MSARHVFVPLAVALSSAAGVDLLAQTRTVTLGEAIRRSELVDPQVVQAQGNVRNTSAGVRAAHATYLPTLSTNANLSNTYSGGPSRVDPVTGEVITGSNTSTSVGFGASTSYDLFTGFRRGKDISAAKAQRSSAEAGLEYSRAQNRLTTSRAFVQALQATSLVQVRRESIRRAEEQFRIASAKLATRSVNIADSLQAALNVAQAQLQLVSDEQQLAASEASLARAIGETGRVQAIEDSSLLRVIQIGDTAALIAEAMTRAPEVIRADAAENAARANHGAARAQYFPSVNLSADTRLAGNRVNDYTLFGSRNVGIGLSWQVFNRFQRELQVARTRSDMETAITQTADVRRRVGADMVGRLASLLAAEERIRIAQRNVETLRALVRVQLERYRIGSIDNDFLSRAQEQLNNAESEAVRARFDYVLAKAEIEALLGRSI